MIEKNCLIIDDEATAQGRIFESMVSNPLKKLGIDVNLILIDPTDKDLQTEEKIDRQKLEEHIKAKIEGLKIDIVGCDYELSSEIINGTDVVQIVRSLRNKVKIFLYSGKYEKVIGDILNEYTDEDPSTKEICVNKIKKIYGSHIEDFIERSNYPDKFIGILKKNEDAIDDVFLKKMREYGELSFKSCFPKFEGKTLLEISNEIEKGTHSGQKFIHELVEQTVAYLTETNAETE